MLIIKNNFITKDGIVLKNVRNVHFECKEDLFGNIGQFLAESCKDSKSHFDLDENGVYLFKSTYDNLKGLRLYKDYGNYMVTFHNDENLIYELQKRQSKIKKSKFPTGVVTIEDKVIGQEVHLFENQKTILNYFENNNIEIPTKFYLDILGILKEMYYEGITYSDVHTKNFLIDEIENILNIIDFETGYVTFDNTSKSGYETMIINLKYELLNRLNKLCGIKFSNDYEKAKTLEEIEYVVMEADYKLKVKE